MVQKKPQAFLYGLLLPRQNKSIIFLIIPLSKDEKIN